MAEQLRFFGCYDAGAVFFTRAFSARFDRFVAPSTHPRSASLCSAPFVRYADARGPFGPVMGQTRKDYDERVTLLIFDIWPRVSLYKFYIY